MGECACAWGEECVREQMSREAVCQPWPWPQPGEGGKEGGQLAPTGPQAVCGLRACSTGVALKRADEACVFWV